LAKRPKKIVEDSEFPDNPGEAIKNGLLRAEREFLQTPAVQNGIDKSGSCALLCIIVDNIVYVGNVGDSRAVLSKKSGKSIESITTDHKPNNESEMHRIVSNGGRIYKYFYEDFYSIRSQVMGANESSIPQRVFPGRLSVSRTIGDAEAKLIKFKGNPKVVIPDPDIYQIKLDNDFDFIMLGCDGIFDRLSTYETIGAAWKIFQKRPDAVTVHPLCGEAAENILRTAMLKRTLDNVTVVIIAFENIISQPIQIPQSHSLNFDSEIHTSEYSSRKLKQASKLIVLRKCKKHTVNQINTAEETTRDALKSATPDIRKMAKINQTRTLNNSPGRIFIVRKKNSNSHLLPISKNATSEQLTKVANIVNMSANGLNTMNVNPDKEKLPRYAVKHRMSNANKFEKYYRVLNI